MYCIIVYIMSHFLSPVTTYEVVNSDHPNRGEITARAVAPHLSSIWGGNPYNRYDGIWNIGQIPGVRRGYAAGEHLFCPTCSQGNTFDEPAIPLDKVPFDARFSSDPTIQFLAVQNLIPQVNTHDVCQDPRKHANRIQFFWSIARTTNYISQAITHPESKTRVSFTLNPFLQKQLVAWAIAYHQDVPTWLNHIEEQSDLLPLVESSSSGSMFYVDTVGRDTRPERALKDPKAKGYEKLWGSYFSRVAFGYGMLDIIETLVPEFYRCHKENIPIIFRSSEKEGAHVLMFARGFFKDVDKVATSKDRADRQYYLARSPQLSDRLLGMLSKLPGTRSRLKKLTGIGEVKPFKGSGPIIPAH